MQRSAFRTAVLTCVVVGTRRPRWHRSINSTHRSTSRKPRCTSREMARDRLEDVVCDAHLGELGDYGMPQIVEAQALQARCVTEHAPDGIPFQHRLGRIEPAPLTCRPEMVLRVGVSELVWRGRASTPAP